MLLSNFGKRTAINQARLAEIAVDASLYDAIVTSGEATWQALAERTEPFLRRAREALHSVVALRRSRTSSPCFPTAASAWGPRAVAHHYEQLGGNVGYVGKPHSPIYLVCLEALGHPPHEEVLTIGIRWPTTSRAAPPWNWTQR